MEKQSLIALLLAKIALLLPQLWVAKNNALYNYAVKFLGTDASPVDLATDMYGCAETVTTILNKYMEFPIILGTSTLNAKLAASPKFRRTYTPTPGCIIISPTTSKNVGHVGFVGQNSQVLSNDSYTGKFSTNYTITSWIARYQGKLGLDVIYYTLI